MNRMLVVDYERCTGCRNCEMACSVSHGRASNPAKSAVRVVKWVTKGLSVPVVCQQCEVPACANICPVQALSRDADTGAMVVDYDLCVGCRMCIVACPFGAITFDMDRRQAIKCDLCGGVEPWCVRLCEPGALTYELPSVVSLNKKRAAGRRLGEALGMRPSGWPSEFKVEIRPLAQQGRQARTREG
jgi:Fe-S-cluster-containing hydrogenase component 2